MQFSKLTCCVYHVTFFVWNFCKKALFQKDMLEKCCWIISYWWHMEKILLIEKISMPHNAKYYAVKSLKRKKVKSSEGCEKKKN